MPFRVFDLGLIDFQQAYQFQKDTFQKIKNNDFYAALILCRHYPVITLGRSAKNESLKLERDELRKKGIPVFKIERGGDVTYHGPGQLTAYPVFNLAYFKKDIHLFLRKLEDVAIAFLADCGVKAMRHRGLTGVWIGQKKIASVGIAIRNWITFHGLSINIKREDLANFKLIRPCGMDIKMTSVEVVLNKDVTIEELKQNLISKFRESFKLEVCYDQSNLAAVR